MFTIGQLAKAGDVGVETVRYYQRLGLLDVPPKTGAVRRYQQEDVRRLQFIRKAKAAGFTLNEILGLLVLDVREDRERAQAMAQARLNALDAHIAELEESRALLQRVVQRCKDEKKGPCPILASFEV